MPLSTKDVPGDEPRAEEKPAKAEKTTEKTEKAGKAEEAPPVEFDPDNPPAEAYDLVNSVQDLLALSDIARLNGHEGRMNAIAAQLAKRGYNA